MSIDVHFEIDFHTEYKATAQLKTEATGRQAAFLQTLLFCQLAARQMHNLRSNPVSTALAEILAALGSGGGSYGDYWQLMTKLNTQMDIACYIPFIAALGVDVSKLVGMILPLAMYRTIQKLSNEQIAHQICPEVAKIDEHKGVQGQKRFIADVELQSPQVALFNLDPKGFGFLAQGVNYYAPMSVILTFNYLHSPHDGLKQEDIPSWRVLANAANHCGNAFLEGKITGLSQATLPLQITNLVFASPNA